MVWLDRSGEFMNSQIPIWWPSTCSYNIGLWIPNYSHTSSRDSFPYSALSQRRFVRSEETLSHPGSFDFDSFRGDISLVPGVVRRGKKSAWCPLFTHVSSFHGNLHTTPLH